MTKLFSSVICMLVCFSSMAQVGTVADVTIAMSQGSHSGFKVLIPEANAKDAAKAWERLMKDYGAKTNKINKSDEMISENALIQSIEDKPITVYANFNETPDGVYMNAFFKRGDNYLNSSNHPQKSIAARGLLRKFANSTALEAVTVKVARESKSLDKLGREKKSLEKDKEGYDKDIKKAKETIESRESDIEKNTQDQIAKNREMDEQKQLLNEIKKELGKYK